MIQRLKNHLPPQTLSLPLPPPLLTFLAFQNSQIAYAGKRRVHITDDLDDVYDDEEDEDWKEWGKKPTPNFQPSDITKMEPSQIQAEMVKRHTGPVIGFVKLRLGVRRTPVIVEVLRGDHKEKIAVTLEPKADET